MREIVTTDHQIDRLVYELYGLTEPFLRQGAAREEINIFENL
jgi:hypothetical protein